MTGFRKNYNDNLQRIFFSESLGANTIFNEIIIYNHKIGTVIYSAGFYGNHGYRLPVIDITT